MAGRQPPPNRDAPLQHRGPPPGRSYQQPFQQHRSTVPPAARGAGQGHGHGGGGGGGGRGFGQLRGAHDGRGRGGHLQQQRYHPVPRGHDGRNAEVHPLSQGNNIQQAQVTNQQQVNVLDADSIKAKKPRPPFCWRCKRTGHQADECKANLDCFICNKNKSHVSSKCPLLKLSKPSVSFPGFGKGELGFLRMPDFDFKLETPEPAPTALVKVTGGKLDAEVVQTELARLTRAEWNWEALPHGEDSFLVAYPSDEELKRLVDIDFRLKNYGVTLTISEWQDAGDITPSYHLDEVWVHVSRVPHAWRHYLGFWALGSVIGTTLEVDMWTYRKKGVIRILVGIMNRDQLPLTTDIVFDREGYHITFTLEGNDFEPAIPPPDDNDSMDHDPASFGNEGPSDENPNQGAKKQKGSGESSNITPTQTASGPTPMQHQIAVTPFGRNRPGPPATPLLCIGDKPPTKLAANSPRRGNTLPMRSPSSHDKVAQPSSPNSATNESRHVDNMVPGKKPASQHKVLQYAPIEFSATGSLPSPLEVGQQAVTGVLSVTPSSTQSKMDVSSPRMGSSLPLRSPSPHGKVAQPSSTHSAINESPQVSSLGPGKKSVTQQKALQSCISVTRVNKTAPDGQVKETPLGQAPPMKINLCPALCKIGQTAADEDMVLKAMKRAAIRNLDLPLENKTMVDYRGSPCSSSTPTVSSPDYLFSHSLAPYVDYFTKASFTGIGSCGITKIGAGGQGVFYPGKWVAV